MDFLKEHYINWRKTRVSKVLSIYGNEFFNNKKILELGAGHGHIGEYFIGLNSDVTFAEGREAHVRSIKERFPNNRVIELNQDERWDLKEKFDIIIHWGVLYHLKNWKQDLKCTLRHSDLVFLESEVSDSFDKDFDPKIAERRGLWDQALNGVGSRPSALNIENFIRSNKFNFKRYDDPDLNSPPHFYDWKEENTNLSPIGQRRFWIISK